MNTTTCPDNEIALFSADGQYWFDESASEERRPISWEPNENVTKVVIGSLPREAEDEQTIALSVPNDLANIFPNLTHLHLWQISDLTELPQLPAKLRFLDVRGCGQLQTLPDMPDALYELDLGGCAELSRLPAASLPLERLFVNDCAALDEDYLTDFWLEISRHECAPQLIEFDGSRCPAVRSLKRIPRSMTRLVLEGCENLSDVSQLAEFTRLTHLNLSACPSLHEIPDIPTRLQYVQLHDSDNLMRFMGQDIGPYDRGDSNRPNVAKTLYSRRKFGHELVASAHAKLLLLGDGRVGKSTLAKRLRWESLPAEQQDQSPDLRPNKDEPFTHKVRFAHWETPFQLSEDDASALNQRAATAGLTSPCDAHHSLAGSVRVWDFGGQEIYHQTHRLFASEGSVFLILWTAKRLSKSEIKAHKPPQLRVSDEEWEEWNRTRSLDYWLEYVQSIRPSAVDTPVCTRVRKGEPHPPWTELAPQHAGDELPCFYIDSLEEACPENPEYQKLVDFIRRTACADEAQRIGILQPAYYAEVSDYVDNLLGENEAARTNPSEEPQHLLVPYQSWADIIVERHRQIGHSQQELTADDVGTITGYLHDAGQIFHLRDPSHPAILIDQEWATDVIYKIIRPALDGDVCLFNVIRDRGGHFDEKALQGDPDWQALSHDVERQQILSYMQQCGIIVRIQSGDHSWDRSDHYLATEKWLLPEYTGDLETRCESIFQKVLDRSRGDQIQQFSFEQQKVSEFDFRSLMAHLGRILGTRATWFRNGLQAVDDFQDPHWCFQVRWTAADDTGFLGHVTARLTCPGEIHDRLAAEVEQTFAMEGSPFARRIGRLKREALPVDDLSPYFRDTRDSDFDLAISSSGSDHETVRQLVEVLKAEGIRVFWYRLPECRADDNAKVMEFMEGLRNPRCILLILSDGYLKNDPEQNWYCPWELADAILRIQHGRRSIQQTLVAYALGGKLNSNNLPDIAVKVLGHMSDYFDAKYGDVSRADKDTFRYYLDWSDHFRNSVKPAAMGEFFKERGTLGCYSQYEQKSDRTIDFSGIVGDVRSALGRE